MIRVTMSGTLADTADGKVAIRVMADGRGAPKPQTFWLNGAGEIIQAQIDGLKPGGRLMVTGWLTQARVPLMDATGKACLKDGLPLEDRVMLVRAHKVIPCPGWIGQASDMVMACGRVTLTAEPTFWATEKGLSCWRGRIKTGGDWFAAIAFGATADKLTSHKEGDEILIDWGVPANPGYVADVYGHGQVVRHSPEILIRSFAALI